MQNHNCMYARYCENYAVDRCQGCGNTTQDDAKYVSYELDMLFGCADNTERRKNMALLEKKSYRDHMDGPVNTKKTDYNKFYANKDKIKDVIFNPPATIVLWNDGTKTVVKAGEHDIYDPEKGLAMAIAKKFFGNEGNYYNNIRKFVEPYQKKCEEEVAKRNKKIAIKNDQTPAKPNEDLPWQIWFMDSDGLIGRYYKSYKRRCNAVQIANRLAKENPNLNYVVSQTDPWGDPNCQA